MLNERAWPKLAFAQCSDPGRDPTKQVNEDAAHYAETHLGHLLVVCDGMGGHSAGREASTLAVRTIFREVSRAPASSPPGETLRAAIATAGRRVFALGGVETHPAGRPGSTCVALLMHPGGTEVAHAGDSRAYLARRGRIWQLTRDHSMVQQLVDAGLLRAEEMATHPEANKITRALGTSPEVDVELRHDALLQEARDIFMLVSDGITDVVTGGELLTAAIRAAETGNAAALCESVLALALARGGPDNATIQAAIVLEPGLSSDDVAARAASQTLPGEPPNDAPGQPEAPAVFRPNATLPLEPARLGAKPAPPSGGVVPLAATPPSQQRPPQPVGPIAPPKRPLAPTLIDEAAVPPPSPTHERWPNRKRLALGATLALLGVAVVVASLWALAAPDEPPPPLTHANAPSASASTHAPAPFSK